MQVDRGEGVAGGRAQESGWLAGCSMPDPIALGKEGGNLGAGGEALNGGLDEALEEGAAVLHLVAELPAEPPGRRGRGGGDQGEGRKIHGGSIA